MKNLLIITQRVDEKHDLLGFFVDWLREFSKHFENVFVITLAEGDYDLPSNVKVFSLGKEKNNSRIARVFNFYKLLFKLIPKSDGIFAHMSPIFVVASWPVAFIFNKKIILWYLHRSVTFRLRLAKLLCYKIVTASKESLGIKGDKIVELGHGINTEKFKTERSWDKSDKLNIISVGRISPIKNLETLINALSKIKKEGIDFDLKIIGRPIMGKDFEYEKQLKNLTVQFGLESNINFIGFVSYTNIARYYKEADFDIGALPTGGIDKAMLEGMAAGCIVLTSNTAFRKYFGNHADELIFTDVDDLAHKLKNIFLKSDKEKREMSNFLYNSVNMEHDLVKLVNNISKFY